MDAVVVDVVPQETIQELTQILSNLVLGDNEIRARCVLVSKLRLSDSDACMLMDTCPMLQRGEGRQ
jgi:hypothetical protein